MKQDCEVKGMNLKDLSVSEFSAMAADQNPSPGGGSVAAMAGAFSASLACMVAKLTREKKGYEQVREQMEALALEAEGLRLSLLEDIQNDSASYNAFMEALKLPKDTEEQKAIRAQAMQDALKGACAVPLEVAKKALKAMELATYTVEHGNVNAMSDGLVGALMGRAAVLGAINNVRINLGGIKDADFVKLMQMECNELEHQAHELDARARATFQKG